MNRPRAVVLAVLFCLLFAPVAFSQGFNCNGTCEPDPGSNTYQQTVSSRTLVENQRSIGRSHLRHVNEAANADANPGSSSYSYAIPVVHLPGRNGLDVDLTLYYNSHVWNTTPGSSALTLNADRDFPDYGFRLDYGYVELFGGTCGATGSNFILTEPDGTKRQLNYISGNSYHSSDTSYIDFNCSTGLLQRRDGTRWTYTLGSGGTTVVYVPTQIKDTNGNYISITYLANPSNNPKIKPQDVSTITDTLARTINYNYETTDYKLLSVSGPAPNSGTQNYISFAWGTKNLVYTFSGLTVDNTPTSGSSINIITGCTYPNGTGYSFTWGDWATISQITAVSATGATRSYVAYNFPAGTTALSQPPTYTQQTIFDGVNTANWGYSTTYQSGVPGQVSSTVVTDPSGTTTTTNFNPSTSGALSGLPSSTVIKSGATTLRTVAFNWSTDSAGNPILSSQTTTLDSGQQSTTSFAYDLYYNTTNISEYDFGAVLTRQTQTTYQTSSAYTNQHIVNLPTMVKILDGNNAVIARTDFAYDGGTLTSQTGATNHDDPNYGTSFTTRGNLTQTTRYTNAAAATGPVTRAFTYNTLGNILTAQVDCCQSQTFSYSSSNQYAYPASVTKGSGTTLTTSFAYDVNSGLLTSVTGPNNDVTGYQFDSSRRLTQVTRPDNAHITQSYDDNAAQATLTSVSPLDASRNITQVSTADGLGRTLKTEATGGTVDIISEQQFDTLGRVSQASNPHSPSESQVWTTYAYDALSRPTTVTPPGSAGTIQYSYSGSQTTTTDPAGLQRRTYNDALGRLVRVDEPGYDDGGKATATLTVGGSEGCVPYPTCDTWDSVQLTVYVNGVLAGTSSPAHRNITASTMASTLSSSLNTSGLVTSSVSNTTITITSAVGGAYTNYSLSYSSIESDQPDFGSGTFFVSGPSAMSGGTDGTGADGHAATLSTPFVTTYAYDPLDDLLTVTQGVQTRSYLYNSLGQLLKSTTPEAGTTCFGSVSGSTCNADGYDSFGNLLKRTDARGVLTTYGYDGLNRPSSVTYTTTGTTAAATPTVNYYYDEGGAAANALGRLTHFTDGVGSETYTYNSLGQTVSVSKVISSTTYPLSYAYNLAGELTSITYPSNRVVQPSYDAAGRLSQLASGGTNYVSSLQYNSASEPLAFTYGNGVQATFTYNSRLQLASLAYAKGASTIFSSNYYYSTDATKCASAPSGNNGQIQCIADNVDSTRSATYTYDVWARLKTAATPQWGLSFTYDRFGNRTQQNITSGSGVPSNSLTISPTTNRVTGGSYDSAGNMLNDGSNTLAYDAENHVVTATNGSASGTYTLDGNGLRVKKVSGSTTTVYIFSGPKVIAEYDNGAAVSSPSREYLYAGSQLVAKIEAGATNYFHPDHLSTRANTDSSGNVSRTFGHYPFGETWYENTSTNKLKFTTYERDAESGNDYAMARSYINRYGRFSSTDPLSGSISDPQSLNRYSYSRNDPINLADPSGMFLGPPHPPEPNPNWPPDLGWPPALGPCTFGINSVPWIQNETGVNGDVWACNDPNQGPGNMQGSNSGGGSQGTSPFQQFLDKLNKIKDACDQIKAANGGSVGFDGGAAYFDASGGLNGFSVDLGHKEGYLSAQLAGRDDVGRPDIVFAFSKPYKLKGKYLDASIDAVLFSGSTPPPMGFGQAGAFTAASGSVDYFGNGRIAQDLILRGLNGSDTARGLAIQIGILFGSPCEGILGGLAVLGKF